MRIVLLGINHKTAFLKVREKYSLSKKNIQEILLKLFYQPTINSAVILSTCNRFEVYATTEFIEEAKRFLIYHLNIPKSEEKYFYFLKDREVIKHLFSVACGLDSQIVGENQILEQIRSAWQKAKTLEVTNCLLDKVFDKAIEVSVKVRSNTKISCGKISIGSIVLELLKKRFSFLTDKKILIIGVGKISELVMKYLSKERPKIVFIANRTYEKAKELAEFIQGEALRFDQLKERLKEADIVISATSSPHLILRKEDILEAMSHKLSTIDHQRILIIDLAVPRDIDPAVKNIERVELFDLEDLNFLIEKNIEKRKSEIPKAEKIIYQEVDRLCQELCVLEPEEVPLP